MKVQGKFQFLCFSICFICILSILPAQTDSGVETVPVSPSAEAASRRTALRCLQLSRNFMLKSEWSNAARQAALGCRYDGSISDLWYIQAESLFRSGSAAGTVLPLVAKAVTLNTWVDNNRDEARLLYARLLSDTTDPVAALEQLDNEPVLNSADAEYLRILSRYRLGTEESIAVARTELADAVKLFPSDNRFSAIFFQYELQDDLTFNPVVTDLADMLVQRFFDASTEVSDVTVYAAAFASGEKQRRMLQAYNGAGLRHPLYAILGLKCGLLTEEDAYLYFCDFAQNTTSLTYLEQFASLLTEKKVTDAFIAFLTAYDGIISLDINSDKIDDVFIRFSRGRAETVTVDWNQDGLDAWTAVCDYGVPVQISFPAENTEFVYHKYPFLDSVTADTRQYRFIDDEFEWTPLTLFPSEMLETALDGFQFFVPRPKTDTVDLIDESQLMNAAVAVTVTAGGSNYDTAQFSVLNGKFQTASYYQESKQSAELRFKDGFPDYRLVDSDGDGRFERTEYYRFSPAGDFPHLTQDDSAGLYMELFAGLPFPEGVYLSKVLLDTDLDTTPDFQMEYTEKGTVLTWGNPENWSVRYTTYIDSKNTEASFRLSGSQNLVTVFMENTVPVRVTVQNTGSESPVIRDMAVIPSGNVYWLGEPGDETLAQLVLQVFAADPRQGVCHIVESEPDETGFIRRITAVKIENTCFGVIHND